MYDELLKFFNFEETEENRMFIALMKLTPEAFGLTYDAYTIS